MERDARHILSELLVLRAQGGDEQAFAELFSLWRQDVVRLAATRLGSPEAAEEVAQNAWIAIARGLGGLDDPACFLRWAFRIVERRAADYIRRRQKERREATALEDYAADQQAIETTGAAANAGESARLHECIARMDAPTRELLHLFYTTGLSVGEIADLWAMPPGTIKSRLYHAREELKRQIERTMP